MTLARSCSLAVLIGLHGTPGLADNIWTRTVIPTGPATYADGMAATPAPRQSQAPQPIPVAAPNFNAWRGPAASAGGFPGFCGAFGFGGNGFGFSFGF